MALWSCSSYTLGTPGGNIRRNRVQVCLAAPPPREYFTPKQPSAHISTTSLPKVTIKKTGLNDGGNTTSHSTIDVSLESDANSQTVCGQAVEMPDPGYYPGISRMYTTRLDCGSFSILQNQVWLSSDNQKYLIHPSDDVFDLVINQIHDTHFDITKIKLDCCIVVY